MNLQLNGTVVLWQHVKDVEESAAWYQEYIGLTKSDSMGDMVFFSINGDRTKLALIKSDHENPKDHAIIDFQSSDIKKTYQLLKGRGVRVDELENPYWIYHEFHFYDLDGNKIKCHGFAKQQ